MFQFNSIGKYPTVVAMVSAVAGYLVSQGDKGVATWRNFLVSSTYNDMYALSGAVALIQRGALGFEKAVEILSGPRLFPKETGKSARWSQSEVRGFLRDIVNALRKEGWEFPQEVISALGSTSTTTAQDALELTEVSQDTPVDAKGS